IAAEQCVSSAPVSGVWPWQTSGHGREGSEVALGEGVGDSSTRTWRCTDVLVYRRDFSYCYRYHEPASTMYERCVGLSWCWVCRCYNGAMVYIPRGRPLWDALAEVPDRERERLSRSEVKLLDHLDRLVRRGLWPTTAD